jgi:ribosomal protein S10
MPYHLELGSSGHSFHGKAIVVNSQTGEHKSKEPIPMPKAKAQLRLLESLHKKESSK